METVLTQRHDTIFVVTITRYDPYWTGRFGPGDADDGTGKSSCASWEGA